MRVSETPVRRDSRLFEELCCALLRRGNAVKFRVNGQSMSPNLIDDDDVIVAPVRPRDLRRGDVVLGENSDGLRVHRVDTSDPCAGVVLRSDTGFEIDAPSSRVLGRVVARRQGEREQAFNPFQTRLVHPMRIVKRRALAAAKLRLRRFGALIGLIACCSLCAVLFSSVVRAQTADLQLTQTASSSAVATSGTTQSLGTASTVTWAGGVASFTFPTPLPSGVFTNAQLTTTGFTPPIYNVTNAAITSVNAGTGVVTVALAGNQSLGTATAATWAGGVLSFTFPTPLATDAVAGDLLTTTGFTPSSFNVTNATITSVNTTTGAITVALTGNQNLGTATAATWAGGVLSFTFPTPLPAEAAVGDLITTTGFTPGAYNVTNAAITGVNTTTGAVTVALSGALGTATSATWANTGGGTASLTFPTPLPAGAVVGDLVTTTGFTPAAYNITNATITGVNTTTGVITIALASQTTAKSTRATWANTGGGTATFTFPTPLPTELVVGSILTTTGFLPAGYNVTNAVVKTVAGGVVTVALTTSPGANTATTDGTGTVNPATATTEGTGTANPATPATANGSGVANPAATAIAEGTGAVNPSTSTTNGTGTVPTGYSYSEVVTNNSSSATVTSGTITVYMQTPANTVYESYSGTNWTCTTPTAGNAGPIICTYNTTLASGTTASTLTLGFQIVSGTTAGTTILSSATVTNSTFVDTVPSNNTSITSIVVEPTTSSDLAVSMTVSPTPVFITTSFTYTIQVQNLGQATAAAASNVLSDTLPSNVTFSSYTASSGWSCPTTPAVGSTGTVSCSIVSPMAMGSTATISITVNAPATAATVNNTATVSLSGDPNSANNSATAYTVVQPIVCASPGRDGAGGTLTGVVNAYYPPATQGTLASGSTSVTLGAAAGSPAAQTPISAGDLLLIVQMQDADINATNTSSYGHGVPGDPGSGSITVSNSGLFEFVTATNSTPVPVTGGVLTFTGTGPTGGLLNSYSYVPFTTSSVKTATAAAWAGNIATFTFPAPLPSSVVPNSVLTTTGFTPTGYNVTNATILTANTATGVVTVAMTTNPGTATALGTGSSSSQGQQTYQVIRVPQYTTALLSSGLVPLAWNGSVGGVLAIDVSSQLTLGGTVAADALGFRGGGGINLTGATGLADTDYVTTSPTSATSTAGANGSKGEGIAGTPHWIAPPLSTITTTTVAVSTAQTFVEGLPGGSYARGAPGNAGGGGTDGDPTNNDYNSGGGAGGNGGSGGQGGYGWNSMAATNSTDGGFGGQSFPASTSALVMGGGGGAGTVNNGSYYISSSSSGANCGATCTGIYSSGGAGGGIVIVHAGSVTGTGTITSNGQSTLSTLNDSTGGGGAGGSILVFANSGGLSGLTVNAEGGSAGDAWPIEAPGGFPGERHGPGGGGGGGVIFLSASPAASNVSAGSNGYTDTVQDSYGATPGSAGIVVTTDIITETPGTQSGAYCASADLSVTNSGSPSIVAPGGNITYTQTVTNNGPLDAVNAVFSEGIPANTTFQSIVPAAGWTCATPAVGASTGNITCTESDFPSSGSSASGTFTVVVQVGNGTATGTQIVDVDNITSGTSDPNLANNSATAISSVGTSTEADLSVTNTAASPTVIAGNTFTLTAIVTNNGPAIASGVSFSETTASNNATTNPVNATFYSLNPPSGWTCSTPAVGGTGTISCTDSNTLAVGATATFPIVMTAPASAPAGTVLSDTAYASASTPDPNTTNNFATASVTVATSGQADLAVTSTGTPNPVTPGNNITYTQSIINNGPVAITASTTTTPATTVTFTDTIPTNTTLAAAFTAPTGWTCNNIVVGGTGTFTCTLNAGQTLAVGAIVNFPLVVKVNATYVNSGGITTSTVGTTITNSPNITSSVSDPNTANNTATVTTYVASPNQADVSIIKTASPNPVNQGTILTYSLAVNNAGPAVAQNIVVTDVLPSSVTYSSVSTTTGSCSYATSTTTVTCNIASLSVGGTAIVTISVNAAVFSSSSLSTNTATVIASTSDPNLANNTSSYTTTIQAATAVDISSFNAYTEPDGTVRLVWHTQEESRNLGFHVYREDGFGRNRVDTAMISGSALLLRGSKPQHAAKTYGAVDVQPTPDAAYWLEDVDINGTRTLHGPVYPQSVNATEIQAQQSMAVSPSLSQLNANTRAMITSAHPLFVPRPHPQPRIPVAPSGTHLFNAADQPAVKIFVDQVGWYHVPFSQLFAAGLNPYTDVRSLHLYAEGVEQPLLLIGHSSGSASPTDAIEFYGTGIDTSFTADRAYWLVAESSTGNRIPPVAAGASQTPTSASFPFTVMREDRTVYFAALLNGENNDNFFGAVITSEPTDQALNIVHLDTTSTQSQTLQITLQGATDVQQHSVSVQLNGNSVGTLNFYGEILSTQSFSIEPSMLVEGTNTVTLTALDGDNDVSLVQSIQLQYPHTYTADSDWLQATAPAGSDLHISGFANSQVRVFDITNPLSIFELNGGTTPESGSYSITAPLPAYPAGQRTILAFAADTVSAPEAILPHNPTLLDQEGTGADIVVITYPDFASHLTRLVNLRESQGYKVLVATTDQVFDDYSYGERTPFAMRSFLLDAVSRWQHKPQAILFVGDASMDPRNYLGFGDFDFVPTRIIETAALKTASDDWFSDFQQTGFATIATGRLPARTTADVDLLVSKIVNYEQGVDAGSWNAQALVIADQNVDSNFSAAAASATGTLPASLQTSQIYGDGADPATLHAQILSALNNGTLLVDYNGHGAEQQWSFEDFFDNNDALGLSNGNRLPVYLLVDCLNGLFQDVYAQSLSKALILAPNGGAVAVWASSGFTQEPPQASMNIALLQQLTANPGDPLGVMILHAKNQTADNDVRRTWILLGDPSMKFHFASGAATPARTSLPASTQTIPGNRPGDCPRGFHCPKEITKP
jgi:uncharacterized repeat protein (TIGR01451 family)